MKKKLYVNDEQLIMGMTLKNATQLEHNNMALHACIDPVSIIKNREELAISLHCVLEDFICANQTHSANFQQVTTADKGRGAHHITSAIVNTDALYTYDANLLLCSFTADCVPVFFYNEVTGLIGVIHSGWQGTVKEITKNVFEHLQQVDQCDLAQIHVQIGAALSQEKFEVDEDVAAKFRTLGYANDFIDYNDQTKKYHIDNQRTVKRQCELAGIPTAQITIDQTCTYSSPDGFSYRKDKKAGRHLNFIMRKDR